MIETVSDLIGRARRLVRSSSAGTPERKSDLQCLLAMQGPGQPQWSGRDYNAFAREGMTANPIVYRAVRMISESAASVPLLVYEGDREAVDHPLRQLLERPNAQQTRSSFVESCFGYLLTGGDLFIEAIALGSDVRELHALRPDRVRPVVGADGWPVDYEYVAGGRTTSLGGDAVPGVPRLQHVRLFHPLADVNGLSPIAPAAAAVDIHNAICAWTKSLTDNAARPSGALVYTGAGSLAPDQFDRLKSQLQDSFQGVRNAGRPLLLEGGLDWKPMSFTPAEMDFVGAKNSAARDIALAFGIPPMLLGIPGDNTYSNYQEANRTVWRQTIIPHLNRLTEALGYWLAAAFPGQRLKIVPDLDQVPAMATEREALWALLQTAQFLTINEKREALGFASIAGGDRM